MKKARRAQALRAFEAVTGVTAFETSGSTVVGGLAV